jgi:hypothetical protein
MTQAEVTFYNPIMEKYRKRPWPPILAEGTAIIVSILLAFWIQAWWEARQELEDERVILELVLQEFQQIRESLKFDRIYNEAIRDSARQLFSISIGAVETPDEDTIDNLMADLWWNQIPSRWATPELDYLLFSGDLALISNIHLRHQLGTWTAKYENIRNLLQRDLAFHGDRQMPFFAKHAFLPQLLNADDFTPGHPESQIDYGQGIPLTEAYTHSQLLADREFQNLLIERDVLLTDILVYAFAGLEEALGAVTNSLEAELAR